MSENQDNNNFSLVEVIKKSLTVPGVKIDRNSFLKYFFADQKEADISDIIAYGPVAAGCSKQLLKKISDRLIMERTSESSMLSFAAGIPGGFAMAATIPADMLQFFGMALRLAQELSYIYGAEDLWINGQVDDDKIQSQLILYVGTMFGVSGAASGVRILANQISKTVLKKLPQKALTKTFLYPIVKQICKAVGVKMTKNIFAKGVSKIIPLVGGIVSGVLNFASLMPMSNRLRSTLEEAAFNYSEEKYREDYITVSSFNDNDSN